MTNLIFSKADFNDIPQLKALWISVFEEEKTAVDCFFDCNKNDFAMYCVKDSSKIVSALYLLPTLLNGQKAHYLCGAATLKEYRSNGIMGRLIEYALSDAHKNGDKYSLLLPANENLYHYYSKFGYTQDCSANRITLTRAQMKTDAIAKVCAEIDYEKIQKNCYKSNFLLWNNKFIEFAKNYYGFYGVKFVCSENSFALVSEDDGYADVFYSIYSDFEELNSLLLANFTSEKFVFTGKFENAKTEKYGMIKPLDENVEVLNDVYIGLTLN